MSGWALITGASSGFGVDFAEELAARGYSLMLTARRKDRLIELKDRLEQAHGVRAEVVSADLSEAADVDALIAATHGKDIEVLVNNAGFGVYGEFAEMEWKRLDAMLQVNVVALTRLTRVFGEAMKTRGSGKILLVSSIAAFSPTPTYAAYSASKAFIQHLGESLHEEWKGSGVSVTVVSPGISRTEFFDVAGQKMTAYQRVAIMESKPVVREALEGLFAGERVVVPGAINATTTLLSRVLPRNIQAKIAKRLMKE